MNNFNSYQFHKTLVTLHMNGGIAGVPAEKTDMAYLNS